MSEIGGETSGAQLYLLDIPYTLTHGLDRLLRTGEGYADRIWVEPSANIKLLRHLEQPFAIYCLVIHEWID